MDFEREWKRAHDELIREQEIRKRRKKDGLDPGRAATERSRAGCVRSRKGRDWPCKPV